MSASASHPHSHVRPHLRLVGVGTSSDRTDAARAITRENRAASLNPALEPTDPRWIVAVRAQSQLQGSTLTPERRERILRTARRLGVRLFDANLIIAMVQDRARRGEPLDGAPGSELASLLSMLPEPRRAAVGGWTTWLLALTTAAATCLLLIRWLTG